MLTAAEYAAAYRQGAADLRDAVAGMTREQLAARPVPGKWSTLEVLSHLSDFEPVHIERFKRVISHDNPMMLGADESLFAQHLHYQDRDAAEELAVISSARASMARLIEGLTPEQLARTGTHNERGVLTLAQLIEIAIGHIQHHLPFIAAKRKALNEARP